MGRYFKKLHPLAVCFIIAFVVTTGILLIDNFGFLRDVSKPVSAGTLTNSYIDPSYLTKVPFGSRSHWLQPWRAYMDTMPATIFLNGVGTAWNGIPDTGANPDLIMQMLASHGIKSIRVETGWDSIQPGGGINSPVTASVLQAAKKFGVRPIILLNANSGAPNPVRRTTRTVTGGGGKNVTLDDTSGLEVNKSGISGNIAGEAIITSINGNNVTLSKDLPHGGQVDIFTFTYRPFAPPGTSDYDETIGGWRSYADTVAQFAAEQLGTTGNTTDKGFDMEIWNEMSFGSEFMDINEYYNPPLYTWPNNDHEIIYSAVVHDTMSHVAQHPEIYAGVRFCDGYANTLPWPSAGNSPSNLSAICKHPYATGYHYSNIDGKNDIPANQPIDAQGNPTNWDPSYRIHFPEYYGTTLQTESIIRDMAPFSETFGTGAHGRNANPAGYMPVWVTEVGMFPEEVMPSIDTASGLWYKAKSNARWYTFMLNKGAEKVNIYTAGDGDRAWGVVLDSFINYAKSNSSYPADDSQYTSPTLKILGNMVNKFKDGVDTSLTMNNTTKIFVDSITDNHDNTQFTGDGSAAHPNLYDRDVLTILPYQVNSSKFVIPYYVMTRDVLKVYDGSKSGGHQFDMPPEQFTVTLSGIAVASDQDVSVYDPANDQNVPVTVVNRSGNSITLTLTAADYPYLLMIGGSSGNGACPLKSQGDANCDGKVSLIDFAVWRNEFLGTDPKLDADFNGDGQPTILDFAIWRNTFVKLN